MTITVTKIIAFGHFHNIKLQKHVQQFYLYVKSSKWLIEFSWKFVPTSHNKTLNNLQS